MSNSPPASFTHSPDPLSPIIPSIYSNEGKVMLAAVISLFLVILFVLLLHIYARWLLGQAHQRRRRPSIALSHVLGPTRLHHIHTFTYDDTHFGFPPTIGLDASAIASLPLFVYKSDDHKNGLECVICLSVFEDDDMGRSLPKCQHAFHVECIDMWLHSHSNCPICRTPVQSSLEKSADVVAEERIYDLPEMSSGESTVIGGNTPVDNSVKITLMNSNSQSIEGKDSSSTSPSFLFSSSSSLGCSLKRMMSSSRPEGKVYPSSSDTIDELNV